MSLPGLDTQIALIKAKATTIGTWIHYAADSLQSAGDNIAVLNWSGAANSLYAAHNQLEYAAGYMGYNPGSWNGLDDNFDSIFSLIDDNWPSDGAVTMDAIVSAMLGANESQYTYFVGLIDAYRSALWDAPFNAEFYAALARGFKLWT